MDTTSGTVTVWQSGRLARRRPAPRFEFGGEQRVLAALLVLSAIVLTLFVGVLRDDVARGDARPVAQGSPAVASYAPVASPENTAEDSTPAQENQARAQTLSLLVTR